jgi:hypothetical protein
LASPSGAASTARVVLPDYARVAAELDKRLEPLRF